MSDLERFFASKISLRAVAVTSLPGLLACRPWQAAFGLVWELCHTDCWESSSRVNGNGSKEMGRIGLLCHGSNLHRFGIESNGLGSTLKNAKFKGDNILISTQVHSTQFNLSQFDLSYLTKRVDLILFDLFHSTHFMQSHHPDIRRQGRVLVSQQLFRSIFSVFLEENPSYCLGIFTKMGTDFSTSSRARVFSRLKLVLASNFR